MTNKLQLFWLIYLFLFSSTLSVFTVSDIVHRHCCWLVSWMRWNCSSISSMPPASICTLWRYQKL